MVPIRSALDVVLDQFPKNWNAQVGCKQDKTPLQRCARKNKAILGTKYHCGNREKYKSQLMRGEKVPLAIVA